MNIFSLKKTLDKIVNKNEKGFWILEDCIPKHFENMLMQIGAKDIESEIIEDAGYKFYFAYKRINFTATICSWDGLLNIE